MQLSDGTHKSQVPSHKSRRHKSQIIKSEVTNQEETIEDWKWGCWVYIGDGYVGRRWWGEAQHVIISNSGSGQGPTVLAIQRVWLLTIFPIFYLISTGCKYQLQPVKISNICVLTPSLLSLITREETPVSRDQSPANWCRGRLCLDTQDKRYQHCHTHSYLLNYLKLLPLCIIWNNYMYCFSWTL